MHRDKKEQIVAQLTGDAAATASALAAAAAEVDVVLDYLWGEPARDTIAALLTARSDRSRALNWIQIGAVAGPTLELPSVALRSANLRVLGSGQGAVSPAAYRAELPALIHEISSGAIAVSARPVRLTGTGTVVQVNPAAEAPTQGTKLSAAPS